MMLLPVNTLNVQAKTVTDQLERTVIVPDHPKRIVSLAPSITEIVFAIGRGSLLKGVTQFSNYPKAARQIASVGSYIHLDVEKIVVLNPDLCIAVKDGNPKSAVDKLDGLGIPVYAVDPNNLESVMTALIEIGNLLNAEIEAKKIVADMQARINRVKENISKATHIPKVFLQIGISPIVSVGTQTFLHELIVLAGGKNLSEGPIPYPRYSKEQVLSLSPEIIIITSMEREKTFDQAKKEWSTWSDLPAVKNDRILIADSDILDRATPRLVDGLELIARLIHPELFTPYE
ncbi:MAG: cobalamin-binding protein [Proteobacteria bacterium]|nr:cobalamin-binding protein [Pseudomonadota bacterium]